MKKLLFMATAMLLLTGCEPDVTGTKDPVTSSSPADTVSFPFSLTALTYIPDRAAVQDTILYSAGIGSPTETIAKFEVVFTKTGSTVAVKTYTLLDNGLNGDAKANDLVFSGKMPLSFADSNTTYTVTVIAHNQAGKTYRVTQKQTLVTPNHTPVLGPIITAADTVAVTTTTTLILAVKASDPDGLTDIASVFFKVTRPDGTSNGLEFTMSDNGVAPDTKAADSVYTSGITVNENNTKGTYTFDFFARDRMGVLSNKVSHKMTIK